MTTTPSNSGPATPGSTASGPATLGPSTRAIHGSQLADAHGAPHLPVYTTTTFTFSNTQELMDVADGKRPGALYTRYGMNPTIFSVEQTMAAIEGTPAALAFGSGMAAITSVLTTYGREGVVCLAESYGGTIELLTSRLSLLGITTTFLRAADLDRLDEVLAAGPRLLYFETPTNPTLTVVDIADLATRAHAHGATVVVDNTFASPVNQHPYELGADVIVYSATKYLGGHSDLTAGVALGTQRAMGEVAGWRKAFGSVIAPEVAALLSRSLRTLRLRVSAQNASAQSIAEVMESDPRVRRVLYPGLPSFPGHDLAARQMAGFGGIVTLEIDGDEQQTVAMVDRLRLFSLGPSLGGTESLVTQPVTTTHYGMSPAEHARLGITPSLVRLSIGLEDPADLIGDLRQALDAVHPSAE